METLRAVGPMSASGVTLVPIERTRIRLEAGRAGYWIDASRDVFAVVVCDARGTRALAMDSSELALDSLIEETPNLEAVLSGVSPP